MASLYIFQYAHLGDRRSDTMVTLVFTTICNDDFTRPSFCHAVNSTARSVLTTRVRDLDPTNSKR